MHEHAERLVGSLVTADQLLEREFEARLQLRLTVEDTSVYTSTQGAPAPTIDQMPVFRSFRSTNTLVLRDGQTRDFSAAADRVSGEVVRIAVTPRVVK